MALPVRYTTLDNIRLDDLKFQDLVDEGRKRIRQYCPDWTEYNLSDPGITLLELFAWMTELTVYRLNQVPQKNYIKFLEMLGYGLLPAKPATTELTFRLAAPFPVNPANRQEELHAKIERGLEVSTGGADGEPIVFTTDSDLIIRTPKIKELRTSGGFETDFSTTLSTGELQNEFVVFTTPEPQKADAFYVGFVEPARLLGETAEPAPTSRLAGHILRLTIHCKAEKKQEAPADGEEAQRPTAGHNPQKPPLTWEYLAADTTAAHPMAPDDLPEAAKPWQDLPIGEEGDDRDTTGGLYNETGVLTLFLPLTIRMQHLNNIPAVWVRCRYEPGKHKDSENKYTVSPIIKRIHVQAMGATTTATNSRQIGREELGISSGEPGQAFQLKQVPVLLPEPTETPVGQRVVVETTYQPIIAKQELTYQYCDTFAFSDQHDPHVLLNPNTGEVHFGPNIRQQDGSLHQYGRVPPVGSRIYIEGYRHHAGAQGNVPAGFLRVMHKSVPYVDSVTNRRPVENGRDQETVEEAIMRVQRAMRAQQRAVSASDFETITLETFGSTAVKKNSGHPRYRQEMAAAQLEVGSLVRVKCLAPQDFLAPTADQKPVVAAGTVDLLLVPAIRSPNKPDQWGDLTPTRDLCKAVQDHLQNYCLLARSVQVRAPAYRAIKVTLSLVPYWPQDLRKDGALEEQVLRFLDRYFSPLPYGSDVAERTADLPTVVRDPRWLGWSFGEPLVEARLYQLLREIDGIKYVGDLKISFADLQSLQEAPNLMAFDPNKPPPDKPDLLLCSYQHEVKVERPT